MPWSTYTSLVSWAPAGTVVNTTEMRTAAASKIRFMVRYLLVVVAPVSQVSGPRWATPSHPS